MNHKSGAAAAGTLDPSFGGNGVVKMPSRASAMVALSNKKLLVATGWRIDSPHTVALFTEKGALDEAFGEGGIVEIPDRNGIGIYPDTIVAHQSGGYLFSGTQITTSEKLHVFRLLDDGQLDESFGDGGIVTLLAAELGKGTRFVDGRVAKATTDTQFFSSGWMVVSEHDAKIYLSHSLATDSGFKGVVYRLNQNGLRDTSFNGGHVLIESPDAGIGLGGLAAQGDGVLVGGTIFAAGGTLGNAFVTRYSQNGAIDTSFGDRGRVVIPNGEEDRTSFLSSVALSPGGAIVATGYSNKGGVINGLITVLNSSGSFNLIFNKGVPLFAAFLNQLFFSKNATQQDGKIVVTGWADGGYLMAARYDLTGSLDLTFGDQGWVIFLDETGARHNESVLTVDNKIVILGSRSLQPFAVRYLA